VIIFALSAGGVATCGLPGDAIVDGEGIAGTYVVNGTDPTGIEYSGTVVISRTGDATYDIEWIVTGAVQIGAGRLDGDNLVVEWSAVADPRGAIGGVATYTVGADGTLSGERTIAGVPGVGREDILPEP